ncbi:hypothetical protein DCC35_12845 [Mangrovivirga cuniculi]|uniref:Uncharacterized protein n=2 Tax=Mangrovivirga cuniculi TaxID=2715131 RepID=A0A4D7JQ21_9BACT|nr:hypothetical protein DCC35_12845 [Mangrovivirga cuniculi]
MLNEIMDQEKHLTSIVGYLSDFFGVLSDGYNPTIIWLNIDLENKPNPSDLFKEHWIGENSMENILETKTELKNNFESHLNRYFEWSLEHLKLDNKAPDIFKSEYHLENLNELINKVKLEILEYFGEKKLTLTEYTIDSIDGSIVKYLFIDFEDGSAHFAFGNYVH